jgi:hypothetical protein
MVSKFLAYITRRYVMYSYVINKEYAIIKIITLMYVISLILIINNHLVRVKPRYDIEMHSSFG